MRLKKLNWDSNFFELDVYKLNCVKESKINNLIYDLETGDLVYIFTGKELLSSDFCNTNNCKLVDTKVVFEKQFKSIDYSFEGIEEYLLDKPIL